METIKAGTLFVCLSLFSFQAFPADPPSDTKEKPPSENLPPPDTGKGDADSMRAPKGSRKVSQALVKLHDEYESFRESAGNTPVKPETFKSRSASIQVRHGYVAIDAVAADDPEGLRRELEELGAKNLAVYGRVVSGWLPIPAIERLNALSRLQFAAPAYAETNSGSVDSQGDAAMRSNLARMSFGVDGSGITIGVLSGSFDCLGGAENDIASGDLPSGITVLKDLKDDDRCPPPTDPGVDEGRAMMQIIHDVAPGARLSFHTAEGGQANFAQGILELAKAGAKVIVDDWTYYSEPMFQDGVIAQAVDRVVADGVAYFSSAGNSGNASYEAAFSPSGMFKDEGGGFICELHDFDPGPEVNVFQRITVPPGSELTMSFQWDAPSASVRPGAPGAPNDLDVFLYDEAETLVADGKELNIGSDSVEIVSLLNPRESGVSAYKVQITNCGGPNPALIKYVLRGGGIDQFNTGSSTIFGHHNAAGTAAVGSAFYRSTPAFGVNPPELNDFSSVGGTPILFDTAGNRNASPEIRYQPLIVAPDDVNTSFFGGADTEGDGFPNFVGTSAAAPHAAAVAALMLQANPSLSPREIYAAMAHTAIDMDDPHSPDFDVGFDFAGGCGLVQADAAIRNSPGAGCPGFRK